MATKTLVQLQGALAGKAEEIEGRREALFANPEDIETTHRFRTRIRALRSLVAFVKPWQNAEQNAETQALLKEIVGHTSRLRELDVFEDQVCSNPGSSPELVKLCKREASAERAKVLKILKSKRVTKSFERAMDLAKHVGWKKRYVKNGLPKDVARARFDAMIESVGSDLTNLKLSDEELTHDVRKRAKRARYVAENCDDVLGADAVSIAKGMEAHQDSLGDVCDARANIRLISEFLQLDLPERVVWELNLLRAQHETYLYGMLLSSKDKA